MARSSRHRSHRPNRRSSRDRRERSDSEDSDEEQEGSSKGRRHRDEGSTRSARDSESERRKSTPARLDSDKEGPSGLASGESSGERGKKRKDRSADASDADANRWKGDTDAAATVLEEKDLATKEISDSQKTAKPKLLSSESKSKSSKRHDGSHAHMREDGGPSDESSRRRSEKESSRRGSGSQKADLKDSERARGLGGDREHRAAMDKDTSREASRDRGREHLKDKDRSLERGRNGTSEMERDNAPEKGKVFEKEERSRREKEHMSNREMKQHSGRRKGFDDKREELTNLTKKTCKLGFTEAGDKITKLVEGDFVRPQDLGNTDKKAQDKSHGPDLDKEPNKQGKWDGPGDKEKWQEGDMDRVNGSSAYSTAPSVNGIHQDRDLNDRRLGDKSRKDVGRERVIYDAKLPSRSSRDHGVDQHDAKDYKNVDKPKEKSRLQDNEPEDSCVKEYNDKYIDSRGKKRLSIEKNTKTSNTNHHQSFYYNDGHKADSLYSSGLDSARLTRRRSSPTSAIDVLHDEYRHNPRHTETSLATISRERQHTSSCSSGDFASGSALIDKACDYHSVDSGSRQERSLFTDFPTKQSPASQQNGTPKSDNHISAPRTSEKSTSTGDPDTDNRKGARRNLDVVEINHHGTYLSDGREHSATEEERHESLTLKQTPDGNSKIQLSAADTTLSSSSLHNRSDPISMSPGLLSASIRHGVGGPSAKGFMEDNSRVQSNDRRSNIRYKRTGDFHLGRGLGSVWNGGVPNWSPPFANGFIPFQHGPRGIQPVGQPFPSPSIFGVRPFVDFNLSRVPFHIHENPPDRFSSRGRPLGWCNPSDLYPSRSQGWEGSSGILGNDVCTYGRQNLDQAKNGGWAMDGYKQKGPSTEFIHLQKEPDTSVPSHGDSPRSQNHYGQAHCEHGPDNCIMPLADNQARLDTESLQKAPESSNPAADSGDIFDRKYLSKLDISHDLAQPDLYKHFISLLGNKYQSPSRDINKIQGSIKSFQMGVWRGNQAGNPRFPVMTDALFKKSLSLYNRNIVKYAREDDISLEGPKSGAFPQIRKDSVETVALETEPLVSGCFWKATEPVKKELTELTDAAYANSVVPKWSEIAERLSEANADSYPSCDKTEDGNYDAAAPLGGGVGKGGGTGKVGTGFNNDSTARCENLISPVCLSRIPSSESTH